MTERVKGFVVTLAEDLREDDAQDIATALGMVKGVIDVRPVVANVDDAINRQRIRHEIGTKLWSVLDA